MSIITSRTSGVAEVSIDHQKCNLCGFCVEICKSFVLSIENKNVNIDQKKLFGCIACGHCVAICPKDAIIVTGREMSASDFVPLPLKETKATYDQIYSLLVSRRSTRDFKDKEIEKEIFDKILAAASTAPMGIPPSDVRVMVLQGTTKVREFVNDFLDYFKSIKWMFSPFMLALYRPFLSKESFALYKSFLVPLSDFFISTHEKDEDWLLYNAPLAMYFYGSPYADLVDPDIPATYAMIAAESLGLGTCMIGSIAPFLKQGAGKLKKKYGIMKKNPGGVFVIFGYPKYHFHKGIKRTFAGVEIRN
jgi:nitroreductase/ferredoxin